MEASNDIAVIAMTGRFPGAESVEDFWQNLSQGVESVKFFDHEELKGMGIDEHLLDNPKFVAADAVLDDLDQFDARFFNISPREAEITDPQQRLFLEASWEVMEKAGYAPEKYDGVVGVYAGTALSGYMMRNLKSNRGLIERVGTFKTMLANDKDFLSTKVSYQMGLTGPSVNVNTLCSSSAVAIHLAVESLLNFQTDLSIAGGVSFQITRNEAFFYQEGNIGAPDGHCRAFDERAAGTVSGSGLGVLVLKRLEEAVEDGDNILAVIKGTAINNDGSDKASYTAPSAEGQASVITAAQEMAGVEPESVTYIEAHGTGTNLGDPIEVSGLTKSFQRQTEETGFCALGSVKTNIGHLVTAGGVASVIKTVLALQHRQIPASLNFERPNPKIDFENSPFFVNTELREWESRMGYPLRAGVSSFGIGGTNAHIVLEEAPVVEEGDQGRSALFFPLSAKTDTALDTMKKNLAEFISNNPGVSLADVAYTLQVGRNDFEHRQGFVSSNEEQLLSQLRGESFDGVFVSQQKSTDRAVVFLFPGQGSQYPDMAKSLYQTEVVFAEYVDNCAEILLPILGEDIRNVIFGDDKALVEEKLSQTQFTQPALFVIEYALAKLWQHWGIEPEAMMGHSIGEYVAACLSGVFSLNDALNIVVKRGQLMNAMAPGAMLSVNLAASEVTEQLSDDLWLAAENSDGLSVVSGTEAAIEQLEAKLAKQGIEAKRLRTSHGFHSGMMDPALAEFTACLEQIEFAELTIPFISNVTGDWITAEQATDVNYWVDHLRQPVQFAGGLTVLAEDEERLLLEVGPGQSLQQLAKRHSAASSLRMVSSLPVAKQASQAEQQLTKAVANLWLAGTNVSWSSYYETQKRLRLELPTYPFERQRYWIEEVRDGDFLQKPKHQFVDSQQLEQTASEELASLDECKFDVKLNFNDEQTEAEGVQAVQNMLELRQRIQQLCAEYLDTNKLEVNVSPVGVYGHGSAEHADSTLNQSLTDRPNITTPYVAPTTELQKEITEHWQQILGINTIGIHDNFFDIGGNSLLAATLVTKLRTRFDFEVPLVELLELPTVELLCDLIETKIWLKQNEQQQEETDAQSDDIEEFTL
ncbi:type I polyketide synthase [Pseudoalteromonas luteoviolacea]|uniref:Uncharacterized protein n=1 Tax=Pseudoalteromonas luteoviolacea S4054 TaxID=1129367 RepID=A0A0F6ABY6_9GAMM|nr:type I polyketide synthase [Pseudoalteromonas luteoviolacea]AOT10638.1 hypothetical protein S4054249_22520 [Pseudoalteromonas luteoviolacea]AOT15294.1 hypothetical protein S40542_21075 [Pseudoalteromonas luteoviolacea]AOT20457.1 hypothetical protein S4054_22435 [Pseudoalteromonas luteoviolacea]KKE83737.1 hypothetical protein N479_12990 [Pseudoalteromonas luteoviolacea S4054]KZN71941.1 hypothetical protein N481_17355 [Pseudoalteromonas luteoviolacea S4047-1]